MTYVRLLGEMGTKIVSIILTLALIVSFTPIAYAAEEADVQAAEETPAADVSGAANGETAEQENEVIEEPQVAVEEEPAAVEDVSGQDAAVDMPAAADDAESLDVVPEPAVDESANAPLEEEPVSEPEEAAKSLEIPPALTGNGDKAVQAVEGDGFYAVLLNDGTLWMWGDNSYGQIANAAEAKVEEPVQVLNNVIAVAAGSGHVVALGADGSVWTWGKNDNGQLGDGTTEGKSAPVKVLDGAVAIFAKGDNSGAQLQDGTYRAWGADYDNVPTPSDERISTYMESKKSDVIVRDDGSLWLGNQQIFVGGAWLWLNADDNSAVNGEASADIAIDSADKKSGKLTSGNREYPVTALAEPHHVLTWPAPGNYQITSCRGIENGDCKRRGHDAIDIACPKNTSIVAAYQGIVVRATYDKWRGYNIKIQHSIYGATMYTWYCHLTSMSVKVGQSVSTGTVIGKSGNTGDSFGYHLDFKLLTADGTTRIDPSNWFNSTAKSAWTNHTRSCCKNTVARLKASGDDTPTCKAPTPVPYDVIGGKKIEIRNNEGGSTIRYTVDGKTNPTNSYGTVYTGEWIDDDWPIMGVRAIAYKNGYHNSRIAYLTNYNATTKAPSINSSVTANGARVEISSATKAATIVYTLDGSNPTWDLHNQRPKNGKKYTGAFNVSGNCTVKAIALASGSVASSVTTREITAVPPAKPEIRAAASKVAVGDPIRILWDKDGAASSYQVTFYDGDNVVASRSTESAEATYIPAAAGTYTVRVKAVNKVGESEESDPVTVQAMPDCKVRFVDKTTNDNSETVVIPLDEQMVKWGHSATKPASTPKKRGYTFAGWDRSLNNITEDVDIAAQWEINKYVVRFYSADGSRQLKRQVVEYGKSAEAPEPEAPSAGYVFSGWTVTEADADSDRDYSKVDSNMKLRAVYAWGDEELPIVAQITEAQRTASGNYTVKVKLTNYPNGITTALLRVALKTSAGKLVQTSRETVEIAADGSVEKTVTLKYNGNYVATVAEAEVVGIDGNYRTGGAYSEAATANITSYDDFSYSNWSDWTTTKPTASDTVEVESAVQYRYRDKQTTTSTATSLSGWTRDGTSNTSYGNWGSNQTTTSKPNTGDTLRITNTSTKYNYFHYCNKDSSAVGGWSQDSVKYGSNNKYHTLSTTSKLGAKYIPDRGGRKDSCTGSKCSYGYTTWWLGSTTTTYTYQTRSKTVTYGYYKWGNWSNYSFDETAASGSREVEKRTVYRSRTKIPNQIKGDEDTSGTKQSISGVLNTGTDLTGKQATIMVYNVTNSDPNEDQIQYIGQTTIGAGNTYSFEFTPRYDPTAESGDFIVALGVKGATGLVNVDTIKAPKPEYQVTFQYENEDGVVQTVDTQKVAEGEDAVLPEAPTREGCRFLGWSTTATCVNDNIVVNALFSPRTCTVVWVDHHSEDAFIETYEYGQKLSAPAEAPAYDGYTFKGWDVLLEDNAKTVTEDMVVTAVFEAAEHTVFFANSDGSVFKAVKTKHGEAAELPSETPTAEGMEFVGWDTSGGTPWWNVTDDMIVKPLFAYENTVSSPYSTVELAEGYVSKSGAKVYLETATEGAQIRYTTDGSEPTADSEVYSADEGITVKEPTKIRAMAIANEMNDSTVTDIDVNVTATNDVANAEAGVAEAPFYYGEAVEPGVMVWLGEELLEEGKDYTVEYADNTAIGTGQATVKGIGDYAGEQVVYFDIIEPPADEEQPNTDEPVDINEATVYVPDVNYTGEALMPIPIVVYDRKALISGTDFALSYANNTEVGEGTVVLVGVGNYTGVVTKKFKINSKASGGGSASGGDNAPAGITKAANPMVVKTKAKTVKAKKLKKTKQVVSGAVVVSKAQGAVTYTKVAKGSAKKLSINKKTGKITVKKGTKKGTYKLKVLVKAAGNAKYKAVNKTVTVKVRVK